MDYFENSGAIRDEVGQLLFQAGRYEEAVAMLRQASLLSQDDLSVKERLGLALYCHDEFRETANVLESLVKSEPYSKAQTCSPCWASAGCEPPTPARRGPASKPRASWIRHPRRYGAAWAARAAVR